MGVSERSRMAQFLEHLLASREPWIRYPELRKWRQKDFKFKVILSYIVSLWQAWNA